MTYLTQDHMISDSVTVIVAAQPVVDLGPDSSICGNDSLELMVDPAWSSVLWSDMSTGTSIWVSQPGGYSVQVTDANGCVAVDTVLLSVDTLPTPDIGNDVTVCPGGSVATGGVWVCCCVVVEFVVPAGGFHRRQAIITRATAITAMRTTTTGLPLRSCVGAAETGVGAGG